MSGRKGILLVGGGGFIGGTLATRLSLQGCEVHILTRRTFAEADFTPTCPSTALCSEHSPVNVHFHRGSQDDVPLLVELLQCCDTVIHLASTTTPGASINRPVREAEENLLPALRFIESMHTHQPARLIFFSSGGTVYGNPEFLPADEKQPMQPGSYYGAGKAALEQFFQVYAQQANVPVTILRPSNVYGPGQSLRSGFGLIRHLLECISSGSPLDIWGDGETTRDFLYIEDYVEAVISVLAQPGASGIFNVGSGIATTINQLSTLAQQVTKRSLNVRYGPDRGIDVRAIILDSRKLTATTGWQPRISLLEGIERTWAWLQTT